MSVQNSDELVSITTKERDELKAIVEKFIKKVETGYAKSKETYADMKRVLEILK